MYKLKMLLPLVLLLCGTYIACNKDDNVTTYGNGVAVTFAGRVLDEAGAAIIGAKVSSGTETVLTDENGVFRLKPVSADARNAILQVSKTGYFEFSRAYMVEKNALQTVTIQLLTKQPVGTIDAAAGGAISVPGGARLHFPANAVATKSGNIYSGSVVVYARYLDPENPRLTFNMPGDLRGINTAGDEQILSTYGMLAVEIESQAGQALQVAAGSEVEIGMPIPASAVSAVPAEIPLWHFNIESARWEEEGAAQLAGSEYVGKVKHFSFWNCDFNYDVVNLSGEVYLNDLQHPLEGVEVWVGPAGIALGWGCGHGTTNENGSFSGGVPKGIALEIKIFVWGQCNDQPIYIQTIGPFSSDATLAPIILSSVTLQTISVTGRLVGCNGQPVANGYAKINAGGLTQVAFSDANGNVTLDVPNCFNSVNVSLIGYDLTNLLESNPQTFTTPPNTVALGDIQLCNSLTEYIQYTLDGQQVTHVDATCQVISVDTLGMTEYYTYISSADSSQNQLALNFKSDNQPGTFALEGLYVAPFEVNIPNSNLSTIVTQAAANVGDFITGTFGSSFQDSQGNAHTISGSYRVMRGF